MLIWLLFLGRGLGRATCRDFEIFLVDFVIFAIYLSLPRRQQSLPFSIPIVFYFCAVLLSAFQAIAPTASLFYVWQLTRVFFAYAVVTKACVDDRVPRALLNGMAIGLLVQAVLAIWERFGAGTLQVAGSYGTQNLLGMMSHFVIFPVFALLLAGQGGRLATVTSLAGAVLVTLTTSRATVGLAVFGYFLVFLLSSFRGWTSRKARVALIVAVGFAVLSPVALSSFEERFLKQGITDIFVDESRVAMASAAAMILSDHPMGIGANHYVIVANTQGYNARAKVDWHLASTSVHNTYWLVAAETGYIGIAAFLILLLRPISVAFFCGWRNRRDWRGDMLLGIGVALLLVSVHSYYEWVFVTSQVQYMFAVSMGMIAGLAQKLGYWGRIRVREKHVASSEVTRSLAEV